MNAHCLRSLLACLLFCGGLTAPTWQRMRGNSGASIKAELILVSLKLWFTGNNLGLMGFHSILNLRKHFAMSCSHIPLLRGIETKME